MTVPAGKAGRCAANLVVAAAAIATALIPAAAAQAAAPAAATAIGEAPAITADALAAGKARFGRSATAEQALEAYWTPERMRAASPAEESPAFTTAVRKIKGDLAAGRPLAAPNPGKPVSFPPAAPTAHLVRPNATDPNLPSSHPTAATMGKIFYTQNGFPFECSGTVVNTAGLNSVWTAGHCVYGGLAGPLANWSFIPGYDSDLAEPWPYGRWFAQRLIAAPGWVSSFAIAEDMGVAIMAPHGSVHLVQQVGGQGLQVNLGLGIAVSEFGYPADPPFNGGRLYQCSGVTTQEISVWTQTVKIPCDMTKGASGGGWLANYDGRYGSLNGVLSRIDRAVAPTRSASPYFDDTALALLNQTKNL